MFIAFQHGMFIAFLHDLEGQNLIKITLYISLKAESFAGFWFCQKGKVPDKELISSLLIEEYYDLVTEVFWNLLRQLTTFPLLSTQERK